MSIWGKLAAATTDLSIGGLIGALLGSRAARDVREGHQEQEGPENQLPFTVGVIVLCAKMAKADGSVTTDEVKAFKEAFNVSAAEMKQAARTFNLAKQDTTGYESCAEQLVTVLKGNRKLLEDVLEGLFHVAKADEEVHPQEEQFLGQVAKLFGFTDTEFSYIKARHVTAAKRNPYDVLGVKPSVSDEELEESVPHACRRQSSGPTYRAWRAEGVVNIATEKVATLSDAYDAIVKERSI